jgi:hypothetical protein
LDLSDDNDVHGYFFCSHFWFFADFLFVGIMWWLQEINNTVNTCSAEWLKLKKRPLNSHSPEYRFARLICYAGLEKPYAFLYNPDGRKTMGWYGVIVIITPHRISVLFISEQ